jgi:hypothetical protein
MQKTKKNLNKSRKKMLGWREYIALPELGVSRLRAKIDTGARTSAIHAIRPRVITVNGKHHVRFWLNSGKKSSKSRLCQARLVDRRTVMDSGGHAEKRYVIQTTLVIGENSHIIECTLTNRSSMLYRMLIGRSALQGFYSVDVDKSYNQGRPQKSNKRRVK